MAGGQSLVAMMNLRVAAPDLLIDIARLDELRAVSETSDHVVLGACVTHAAIEDRLRARPVARPHAGVAATSPIAPCAPAAPWAEALPLSDPAADWPAVMAALDAQVMLRGPGGRRSVDAADFAHRRLSDGAGAGRNHRRASASRSCRPGARWGYASSAGSRASSPIRSRRWCAIPDRDYARARARRRQWPADRSRERTSSLLLAGDGGRLPPGHRRGSAGAGSSMIFRRACMPRWRRARVAAGADMTRIRIAR